MKSGLSTLLVGIALMWYYEPREYRHAREISQDDVVKNVTAKEVTLASGKKDTVFVFNDTLSEAFKYRASRLVQNGKIKIVTSQATNSIVKP